MFNTWNVQYVKDSIVINKWKTFKLHVQTLNILYLCHQVLNSKFSSVRNKKLWVTLNHLTHIPDTEGS